MTYAEYTGTIYLPIYLPPMFMMLLTIPAYILAFIQMDKLVHSKKCAKIYGGIILGLRAFGNIVPVLYYVALLILSKISLEDEFLTMGFPLVIVSFSWAIEAVIWIFIVSKAEEENVFLTQK